MVEGYTDVIAAHQVGLANVVGTLGTALGDDHVLALRRLADRVVLIFDGDEAGQNGGRPRRWSCSWGTRWTCGC